MPEPKVVLIPEGLDGERVDVAVARMLGLSRSKIIDLISDRHVLLDGVPVAKSDRARTGSMLEVTFPEHRDELTVVPQAVPGLDVLFDDDHIVVIDKPVGVAAHPSVGWSGPSVLGHLAAAGVRVSTSGVPERQGIVQRLDVGTSGLMVVAKSELAYSVLKQAFRSRAVEKTYHTLIQGHPDPFTGTIDAPIGRHPGADYKMAITTGGRPSITHYETLEAFVGTTLLEVNLETGRTHQIRVHFAALRHPCAGDVFYGADPVLADRLGLERQWLHAVRLAFTHPVTGEPMSFSSPYPADLMRALDIVKSW
jgi:23S rRNA pseudouridine1911/1915/1917 synthase